MLDIFCSVLHNYIMRTVSHGNSYIGKFILQCLNCISVSSTQFSTSYLVQEHFGIFRLEHQTFLLFQEVLYRTLSLVPYLYWVRFMVSM